MTTLHKGSQPRYFSAFLNSQAARAFFDLEAWGSAQNNISVPILASIPVPVPPEQEQIEIRDNVVKEVNATAELTSAIDRVIAKLCEYRAALITNAVTGKIDVRDLARKEVAA